MPYLTLLLTSVASVLFAVYYFLSGIRKARHARQMGCLPANRFPHQHPFGLDLYEARKQALLAGRRNGFEHELFMRYGPTYEERAISFRNINTTDTANFQAVGATQVNDFGREERRAAQPFFGRGILSMNGQEWKQARELVTPLFKRAELMDIDRFKVYVDRLLKLLPRDGSTVDMQPLRQQLFLDSSTEFIFGESIDSLRDTTNRTRDFLQAFNLALAGAGKRLRMGGAFSFLYMFDKEWRKNWAHVHSFIDEKINKYYETVAQETHYESDTQRRYVLIDGMASEIKDQIQLRYHLLNVFFPARDTSAILVSNTLFLLARNPWMWAELHKIALRTQHNTTSFEHLKSLHIFRYTLHESIRLLGPSGQTRRIALRDTVLPRGGGLDGSAPLLYQKELACTLTTTPRCETPASGTRTSRASGPADSKGSYSDGSLHRFLAGPESVPL